MKNKITTNTITQQKVLMFKKTSMNFDCFSNKILLTKLILKVKLFRWIAEEKLYRYTPQKTNEFVPLKGSISIGHTSEPVPLYVQGTNIYIYIYIDHYSSHWDLNPVGSRNFDTPSRWIKKVPKMDAVVKPGPASIIAVCIPEKKKVRNFWGPTPGW